MTTLKSKNRWQCVSIWFAAIAAALLALNGQMPNAASAPVPNAKLPRAQAVAALPFSIHEIVDYLRDALEIEPTRVGATTTFESGMTAWTEDRYRIAITPEGRDVVILFTVGGGTGLSLAREFFEAPFFEREESEQLYQMLDRAHDGPAVRLQRFTVTMRFWETGGDWLLMLRFSPLRGPSEV